MSGSYEIDGQVFEGRGAKLQELRYLQNKNEYLSETKFVLSNDGQPKGGFRIILMVEATAWRKSIIVHNTDQSNLQTLNAGDDSGKVFPEDGSVKYSGARFNFISDKTVKLEFQKAKRFGVMTTCYNFEIPKADRPKFDGKTIILYWQNDESGKFSSVQDLTKLPRPSKDLI